ncbi:hypothetical protein H9L39_05763 [Fusarium oxysporum f. sp. albedinis]|nr:hypothetical protein H9L39_05763 [Fusarium oxysporum f. sp. albedinis]
MAQEHATIVDLMRRGPCKAESSFKNAEQVHVIKRPLLGCNPFIAASQPASQSYPCAPFAIGHFSSVQVSVDFFSEYLNCCDRSLQLGSPSHDALLSKL